MKKWTLVLAGAALLAAGFAIGQDSPEELMAATHWLTLMNRPGDTDKTISHAEFSSYMDKQFKAADADHDGTLDIKELGHLHTLLLGQ